MCIVYIIKSLKTERFYIGYTLEIKNRLLQHNNGFTQSTKFGKPWKLVYSEIYKTKTEAIKRERFLKNQKNRNFYSRLINGV